MREIVVVLHSASNLANIGGEDGMNGRRELKTEKKDCLCVEELGREGMNKHENKEQECMDG